jgi:hypothetical protein
MFGNKLILIIIFLCLAPIPVKADSPSKKDFVCLSSINSNSNKYFSAIDSKNNNGILTTQHWGTLIHYNVKFKDRDSLGYTKGISLKSAQTILDFDGREVKKTCEGKVLLWEWQDRANRRKIEAIFIKDENNETSR